MKIKAFVFFAILLVFLPANDTFAKTTCRNLPQGRYCVAEVDFAEFSQEAYDTQKMSQWCWAACISMLFKYHGHSVSQARIVTTAYGGIVNMPAMTGLNIAQQVNRTWTDDDGEEFTSELTGVYDWMAGVKNIDNNWIINELDNDRPFIVGSGTHAMVGTAIGYWETPYGPRITAFGVFDPWPGRGARNLSPSEMLARHLGGQLNFIATVEITDD